MMQVTFQNNPHDFLARCGAFLAQNEAEHNMILTLCYHMEQRRKKGEKVDIQCSALFNDKDFVMAAVQVPPRNLLLSKASQPEIETLVETLASKNFRFPGIVGPSDVASVFTNKWTQLTGQKSVEYMDQIIYMLKKVLMPPPVEGALRFAKPKEAPLIAAWMEAFGKDVLPKAEQVSGKGALKKAEEMIAAGRAAVWTVKDIPVAKATASGTDSVARISGVYTPPEQRGKGYASAMVAHLSQLQLDQGKKMCCLHADARNPVSNSIYRKIGYEFVGRSSLFVLDQA